MDWTVYNFECSDPSARRAFLTYFEENHPVEIPDEGEAVHEHVLDANGDRQGAEYAWLEETESLYLTSLGPVEGILSMTADHWVRAVEASFDSTTETCRGATLYESSGGEPVEVATFDGTPELGGAGIVWRLAAEHEFRFRAYSEGPPTTIVAAPIMSAFDYVPSDSEEDFLEDVELATGVERSEAALAFLRNDPARRRADDEDGGGDDADGNGGGDADVGDGSSSWLRRLLPF